MKTVIEMAREAGFDTDAVALDIYMTCKLDKLERFAALVREQCIANASEDEREKQQEPMACDGDFPEGFDASIGIPAQALRTANAVMFDLIDKREWDVPCTAMHILSFAKAAVLAEREACAKLVESLEGYTQYFPHVPEAIRARSNK